MYERITSSGESPCADTTHTSSVTPPTSCNAPAFIHVDRCTTSASESATRNGVMDGTASTAITVALNWIDG